MIDQHTCQLSYYQIPTKTNKTDTKVKHNKLDITHKTMGYLLTFTCIIGNAPIQYIGHHMYYRKHKKIILVLVQKNVNHTNLFMICVCKTPFYFVQNICFFFPLWFICNLFAWKVRFLLLLISFLLIYFFFSQFIEMILCF